MRFRKSQVAGGAPQGDLWSRPIDVHEIPTWLNSPERQPRPIPSFKTHILFVKTLQDRL
jgi:hypothetical protein